MRMCVGCREMKPKRELVRVVRGVDGVVSLDMTGKLSGRGAYVCQSAACLARAVKTKALERALEARIDDAVRTALAEELERRGAT